MGVSLLICGRDDGEPTWLQCGLLGAHFAWNVTQWGRIIIIWKICIEMQVCFIIIVICADSKWYLAFHTLLFSFFLCSFDRRVYGVDVGAKYAFCIVLQTTCSVEYSYFFLAFARVCVCRMILPWNQFRKENLLFVRWR